MVALPTDSADYLTRKEVARILKGPLADRMVALIPPLASHAEPFRTVMETPELLAACLQLFAARRELFDEFLQDADGRVVAVNDVRLRCGRSVDEVVGMAVRQGMRSYAELFFGDPVTPPKGAIPPVPAAPPPPPKPTPKGWFRLIDPVRLAGLFHRNYGAEPPLARQQTRAGRFYAAIKDSLDYAWQVQFFPIYVQIPSHVFDRLGIGITRMDSEERLLRLAQLAMADIDRAQSVLKDPALVEEMMQHNVLASAAVGALGDAGFKDVHGALGHLDTQRKWDVLANRDTAVRLFEDQRITRQDIEALSDYLHILNEFALETIFDLKLPKEQIQLFVKTAEQALGPRLFLALFGPAPLHMPDESAESALQQQALKRYQHFTQTALRGLVTAVRQLDDNLRKGGGGGAIGDCLATVCRTRRPDLERELKKLQPAATTPAPG